MFGIKGLLTNVLTGASATTSALMIVVAYSDRIYPVDHPLLACLGMTMPFVIIANLVLLVAWLFIKWRRSWIPLVGLLLSYGAIRTYFPLHGAGKAPEGCIKVISYNVCGYAGNKDNPACLDSICNYLKSQNADIVCLQEDGAPDREKINSLFPYNDTLHIVYGEGAVNILGFHSRFPILKREKIDIPSQTNGSVAYYLRIGRQTVLVINNHLESFHLSPEERQGYNDVLNGNVDGGRAELKTRSLVKKVSEGKARRAPQADAIHRYIEAHRKYPIIVCGDFNDTPISYTRHTIAQGLIDCFAETGTGTGVSYNQKGFRFRIDYILCSDDFKPFRCVVDDNTHSSDHYPIVAQLQLDGFFNKRYLKK